ncbi:hypothetical protein C2G38_2189856 [Gigaspora rosea]|uniref:Uncharacterized protein n=1 Tax=Gigaspora rosea TaxID=44941 RepID=A0A397V932_9GLOM|nr:hypothetical protein C2G38_2189856 [Gigaspora rosea]
MSSIVYLYVVTKSTRDGAGPDSDHPNSEGVNTADLLESRECSWKNSIFCCSPLFCHKKLRRRKKTLISTKISRTRAPPSASYLVKATLQQKTSCFSSVGNLVQLGPQSKIIEVKEFCHSYTLIDIWNASISEKESNDIENITPNHNTPICSIIIDNHEIEQINYSPEKAKSSTNYLLYSSGTTGVALKLGM